MAEWLFKDNKISTVRFWLSFQKLKRKDFRLTNKEIPYSVTIQTTTNNLKNLIKINQTIFVKKISKPILIGKAGEN